MKVVKSFIIITGTIGMLSWLSGCTKDYVKPEPVPPLDYVGTSTCRGCHSDIYGLFSKSGHAYALSQVDIVQPAFPDSSEILSPTGYSWSDLSYLIGGFRWKAHFLNDGGYLLSDINGSQYNVVLEEQVIYNNSNPQFSDCGGCHTTGWKSVAEGGSLQDGLTGIGGEFHSPGVQCEACHGKGSYHISSQSPGDIIRDASPELCRLCHNRNSDNSISASNGFIEPNQQYSEWKSSGGHFTNNIDCNTCHDPHGSAVKTYNNTVYGLIQECTDCHIDYNFDKHYYQPPAITMNCKTCHMPISMYTATFSQKYSGDSRSHIFKINTDSTYNMFDGNKVNTNGSGLSLHICYQCHKDSNLEGGIWSQRSMGELYEKATNFH